MHFLTSTEELSFLAREIGNVAREWCGWGGRRASYARRLNLEKRIFCPKEAAAFVPLQKCPKNERAGGDVQKSEKITRLHKGTVLFVSLLNLILPKRVFFGKDEKVGKFWESSGSGAVQR